MKRIEILHNFSHHGARYWQGEIRYVTPEDAGYFCGVGWACDTTAEIPTGTPDLSDKTLDIQNGSHATTAPHISE